MALVRVGLARRVTAGAAVVTVMTGAGLVAIAPAQAQVMSIVVTSTADSGAGSLRDALEQAQASPSDDHITFASSVTGTILLASGQLEAVVGGSSGSLIIEGPGRDVLSVDAGGQSRVLDVHGPGGDARPTLVVSGLTLTRGSASNGGGALRATGTDLTLDQVVVSESVSSPIGGGVSLTHGSLRAMASMITANNAEYGGGIFYDAAGATGGALAVDDSTLSDNTATDAGGGVFVQGLAPVIVTGSTVSGNTASSTHSYGGVATFYGNGGGVSAADLSVVDSRITGNGAGSLGGGVSGRSVVVTGSTIDGNVARGSGGGIQVEGVPAELRVESSTVTGNRAHYGGGLHVGSDLPAEVILSTVVANEAVAGGGLYSGTDLTLKGTILAMNAGGDLAGGGSVSLSRSLVQDPRDFPYVDGGGSIIGEDPRVGSLADHGGPTETMLPASNSPVVDRGSDFGATTDQRGSARPVNDPETPDAVDGSDIGAVELTQTELAGLPQVGSTSRPTITGRVRVGETLHADGGSWEPADVSLSYQWLRNGVPIPGATSAAYTLTPEDFGTLESYGDSRKRISVRVSAAAAGHHDGVGVSDYTDYVAIGVMAMSGQPRVIGKTRVGTTLRARPRLGAISPRPTSWQIRWFLDGQRVHRISDPVRLTLKPRMRGQRVTVRFGYNPPTGYERLSAVVEKPRRVR